MEAVVPEVAEATEEVEVAEVAEAEVLEAAEATAERALEPVRLPACGGVDVFASRAGCFIDRFPGARAKRSNGCL